MILPTGPLGRYPQTSPKPPPKERISFINCWWNVRGVSSRVKNSSLWKKTCNNMPLQELSGTISPQSSKFRKVRKKVNLIILIHLLTGITWDICYLSPKHFTQEKWHQSISLDSLNQKRMSGIKRIIFHLQHWFINNGSKWYTDIVDSKVEDSHHMCNSSKWQHGIHDCFEGHKKPWWKDMVFG